MIEQKITNYGEFWPYYLREHSKINCRILHYIGTTLALLCLAAFIISGDWRLFIVALFCGYGFAWAGHFGIEKNRPATFKYPFWSLFSDFRMYFLALSGRLKPELVRAGM
jgi:hypothetical protein